MHSDNHDTNSENEATYLLWAKVRLRIERAAVPTLGELEGVRLVVVTTSGGRLAKLAVLLALAAALAYFGLLPA